MTYKIFTKTISFILLLITTCFLFGQSVGAATTLDLVTERIMGDDEALKTLFSNTENKVSRETYLAELKKVENRLLESEKLYKTYKLDKLDREIEPEVRSITNALIQIRIGVQNLQQGIIQNDPQLAASSYELLTNSANTIDKNFAAIQQKAKKAQQFDNLLELVYIVLTVFFAVITIILFFRRKQIDKSTRPHKFMAIDRLFKQSLYPLVGAIITLGSLEYTKITGGRTYIITWGLMLIGFIYFLKAVFKYFYSERKLITEEEQSAKISQ